MPNELSFKTQWELYKSIYGDTDFAFAEAAVHHSLVVDSRLNKCLDNITLVNDLTNENTKKHLLYGALRRLLMLLHSYRSIRSICSPKREQPLTSEEGRELDRDINMAYINIRGIMDNLAWCFLYEKDTHLIARLKLEEYKSRVGLFSKDIRKESSQDFWKNINNQFGNWSREFASKRDPVAHGLPIYVIPKFYENEEQKQQAEKLDQDALQATLRNEFKKAENLRKQSQALGKFYPHFSSDPTIGFMPIYPVLAEDIAKLIQIMDVFISELKSKKVPSP